MTPIQITELTGTPFCVDPADGARVYAALHSALAAGDQVELSFQGVRDLTSGFLNAAYGRLLGEYDRATLESRVTPVDITPPHRHTLAQVTKRAVRYFENPQRLTQAEREAIESDAA